MEQKVQIVYVYEPLPDKPVGRSREVYEFFCPACQQLSDHPDLTKVICPNCNRWWVNVKWQQPLLTDDRPAVRCEDPACEAHA